MSRRRRGRELVAVQIPVEKWRDLAASMDDEQWEQSGMGRICTRGKALVIAAVHEANRRPFVVLPMSKEAYDQAMARIREGQGQ